MELQQLFLLSLISSSGVPVITKYFSCYDRSKLASLFGMDKASSKGGNESLTYTAPKEPKKKKAGRITKLTVFYNEQNINKF